MAKNLGAPICIQTRPYALALGTFNKHRFLKQVREQGGQFGARRPRRLATSRASHCQEAERQLSRGLAPR